ncbi:MAG: DUF1080 domain-containing protein, partial [Planctomycetes bacterium]|nr:DUF1080 domain-containing protein [Planctomycetota bacterium]
MVGRIEEDTGMATSPANGADPLVGQSLGQFEIVELIGRGGMGAVYKARQPSLDRWVAIKILSPALSEDAAFVARFAREARAAAAVSHRNIIEIIDVATAGGYHYIAMGYVDGESLAALIHREGRLPQDRALGIMKQTTAALAAAHEAGIIHRDIKPSNILLDRSGEVRVSDFGLAKRLAADASTSTDEQPLGTPAYVSPEMATGKEVDARTDLYSLGATFFHALAGHPPFEGESFSDLIVKVVREPAPPLAEVVSDVDPRLCGIIDRLLRKDPAERPASAQALANELGTLGELHSPAQAAQDEARRLLREAPTVPLTQGRRLAHKAAIERLRREREKSGKRRLLLAATVVGIGLLAALTLPRLLRPSGAPDAGVQLREHNAQSLFQNAKAAAAIGDWAAAQKWLDELSQDYSDTKFVSASRAAVEELRGQIAKGKQAAVPPPVPEVQVRVDEATRTITTDKIKVRWDPSHANRILALELNSVPGLNLTTPVVLRPEATGGCEFTGNAATADDLTLAGLLIGLQCEAQQWTSRYLDSAHKRAEVATRWQRVGRAPVETSFWLAADSARIDFQRTFRFSSTPHTNRLKGLIPFYWYTNGIGLPFTYSRAGKEPGRATAQDFGLAVADWDGRWADMGQIAYFHKPCEHAVTLFGDWDGQAKGSRAAPALSEMRTFTSDVTICGALFLHEQGLGTEEIEKEYERFLKQQREVPGVKLATVSFTAPAESKGLEAISEGEGQFTTAEREGRPALCQERGYLYFRAADDFAKLFQADTGRTALVTTSLLDATPGTVCIEYDSHIENPGEPVGLTAWRRSQRRSLRGTGRWTEVKFELPAARFGHRQNYGADFRLWHDVPLSVNQVTVTAIEEERPPNVPPLLEKGLAAAFYAGQNHERFLVAQRAPWVNFDWRLEAPMPNVPKDAFSTRIVGWLYVPQAGEYTFWFWRDDGVRFYLDGKKLIDDWAPHMGACEPAAVQLGAGWHRLWVEHMEVLNEANISLHWRRGDRDGIVPATLFYCERELLERIRRDPTQDPFAGLKPDTPVKGMEQLAAPPAVEQAEWVSLFDGKTLDGWEVNNQGAFAHHGPVRVEDGRILMCMGGYGTGIRYKGDVPSTNYEIAWEGMRLRGRDWFSILVFPVGSSWCRLEAGGRGANRESGNAFHLAEVDGRVFPGPMTFENDTWYRFRVRVTDAYVEASVDGGPTLKIARAGRRLSSMDLYSTFQPLGFCTWGCDAAQRSIRLRRLKPEEGARAPLPERPGARWALEFDGQTSYVSIPSLRYSGTHPITVEAVVTLPAAGFRGCVVGDTQFGGVSIDLSGAYWVFQVHDGHQYVKARSDEAAVEGRAVSLAGVFDGQRVSLYVNGRRQSSALVLNGPFTASALPVTVGASPAPPGPEAPGFDWPFRGIIHSVRVSKTARYTADFTPLRRFAADPDTLLLLHLDEGQGDIARDSSGKGHHGTIKGAKWVKVDEYAAEKAAPPRLACRLLATLTGHAGWVTSVAFSPDGTLVATASRDRTLKLWEPATGKCLRTFQGHLGWAECVAFSPDGKRLASASMDGTVRVWDIETTRCLVTLDLQRVPTRALAFPSDGKCLASGSDDGVIRLWDVAAEKCVKTMTDPDDRMQVQFLTFSADGKRILTCGTDGKARLWDAATGACLRKQLGPTHEIWCVGFSPDGQRTLSVGTDPAVRVWSADTGAALKVLPTPTVNRGVSFSPDGRWIAASGWQGWLHFWDAATYERLESLRGTQADL